MNVSQKVLILLVLSLSFPTLSLGDCTSIFGGPSLKPRLTIAQNVSRYLQSSGLSKDLPQSVLIQAHSAVTDILIHEGWPTFGFEKDYPFEIRATFPSDIPEKNRNEFNLRISLDDLGLGSFATKLRFQLKRTDTPLTTIIFTCDISPQNLIETLLRYSQISNPEASFPHLSFSYHVRTRPLPPLAQITALTTGPSIERLPKLAYEILLLGSGKNRLDLIPQEALETASRIGSGASRLQRERDAVLDELRYVPPGDYLSRGSFDRVLEINEEVYGSSLQIRNVLGISHESMNQE